MLCPKSVLKIRNAKVALKYFKISHLNKALCGTSFSGQPHNNCYCSESGFSNSSSEFSKKSGFVKAFEKFSSAENELEPKEQSFSRLMKFSKFVDLGDPEGKLISGSIFHIVDDDLYVDFGGKFHCVVSRPLKNGHDYVRGAKVRLSLKDLELSTKFLGSEKDLTLLEADATLVGLISSPSRTGSAV